MLDDQRNVDDCTVQRRISQRRARDHRANALNVAEFEILLSQTLSHDQKI